MRVVLSTFGSRGDVEPMAALAASLRALGVEAIVSAPPDEEFRALLERAGAPLAPAFTPIRPWARDRRKGGPVDLPRIAAEVVAAQFDAILAAAEGCDAIVATGLFPSTAAALAVAERLDVPYRHVAFCPLFLPSPYHRPCAYPGRPHPPEITDNGRLWDLNAETVAALFGGAVEGHRASIGLPPLGSVRDRVFTDRPWLASDPMLGPWRPAGLDVVQTGAWILPDARPLPSELLAFLGAGAPPVYVGFGSMAMGGSTDVAATAVAAARALGMRTVLARGWAGLEPPDDSSDTIVVPDVNQQALFRRAAVVVHHGGAGTTTTATRTGAPQVIAPQVVDQPYWANRVADLGIGVAHHGPTPTVGSLTAALEAALSPTVRARASERAGAVRTDGAARAARMLVDQIAGRKARRGAAG